MTVVDAIEALTLLRDRAYQDAKRYEIELEAHREVAAGLPSHSDTWAHAWERGVYLQARADAEMRKVQG